MVILSRTLYLSNRNGCCLVKPANPLIHGEAVLFVWVDPITLALKTQRPTVGLGPLGWSWPVAQSWSSTTPDFVARFWIELVFDEDGWCCWCYLMMYKIYIYIRIYIYIICCIYVVYIYIYICVHPHIIYIYIYTWSANQCLTESPTAPWREHSACVGSEPETKDWNPTPPGVGLRKGIYIYIYMCIVLYICICYIYIYPWFYMVQ